MGLSSNEIKNLLIGGIMACIISILSINFRNNLTDFFNIFLLIIILIIISVISKRTDEINQELDDQKLSQNRLNEKLKIHELLINMKADIKELQKRI